MEVDTNPGPLTLRPVRAQLVALTVALLGISTAGAATPTDQRGFVSDGIAGGLYFQRCEAGGPSPTQVLLHDKSPGRVLTAGLGEVRRAMLGADRPVYVEFRGAYAGDAAGQEATALQFYRAVGHVASCSAVQPPASNVRLLAEGTQPAWRLHATPAGTRLERVGQKPLQFASAKLTTTDAATKARTYVAAATSGGTRMQLDVTEQACNDSAAESAFGARVIAQWGEQRLKGCAVRF